ncbi:hypothetical protein D9M72_565930 [compost metagenome]
MSCSAGPGNLHRPIRVETAPEGEVLANEDLSKDEKKPPAARTQRRSKRRWRWPPFEAETLAELAQQHDVRPNETGPHPR